MPHLPLVKHKNRLEATYILKEKTDCQRTPESVGKYCCFEVGLQEFRVVVVRHRLTTRYLSWCPGLIPICWDSAVLRRAVPQCLTFAGILTASPGFSSRAGFPPGTTAPRSDERASARLRFPRDGYAGGCGTFGVKVMLLTFTCSLRRLAGSSFREVLSKGILFPHREDTPALYANGHFSHRSSPCRFSFMR